MELRLSKRTLVPLVLAVSAFGLSACGDDDDFANEPRPAKPIVVTAAITSDGISISPKNFGAGIVNLVVTNQTPRSQQVVLRGGAASGRAINQRTGPINPSDTASLKADLDEGNYTLGTARTSDIAAAEIAVGTERPSAKDQLLQP